MTEVAPDGVPSERSRVEALQTLGLPRRARAEEIRTAYVQFARELHPDLHPGDEERAARLQRIATAYDLLRRYHRQLTDVPSADPLRRERPPEFDQRWWAAFGDRV